MPFPGSVDVLTDAPPVTATTRILSSQVLGPQRITVGPVWFNPKSDQYGAKGDGVTDDTSALQAALNDAANFNAGFILSHFDGTTHIPLAGHIYVPDGTYLTTATLNLPSGVTLDLSPYATIRANGTIAGPMLQTSLTAVQQDGWIRGGIWDCNNLAQTAISARYCAHYSLENMVLANATSHTLILGDPGAANSSFEFMLSGVHVWRASSVAVPAGSFGIWLRNATDCKIARCVIVGADSSVRADTGQNQFLMLHGWGYTGKRPTIVFDDNANGNVWMECLADTPATYGWRLRQNQATIIGGTVFNGPSSGGTDNVTIGIHSDAGAGAGSFEVIGTQFTGSDGTHRLAKDIEGDMTLAHVFGCIQNNVVVANSFDQTSFLGVTTLSMSKDLRRSHQSPTEAVLVSGVDATAGELISVTLSAARLVGAPLNAATGQRLTFTIFQDATGGRAVTWNAVFKVSWSDAGNTASKRSTISFYFDGASWNQDGAQVPYV